MKFQINDIVRSAGSDKGIGKIVIIYNAQTYRERCIQNSNLDPDKFYKKKFPDWLDKTVVAIDLIKQQKTISYDEFLEFYKDKLEKYKSEETKQALYDVLIREEKVLSVPEDELELFAK